VPVVQGVVVHIEGDVAWQANVSFGVFNKSSTCILANIRKEEQKQESVDVFKIR